MLENQVGRRPEKHMETAGSLVPDLEGAARSALHPQRYANLEKSPQPQIKTQENKRKQKKRTIPDA